MKFKLLQGLHIANDSSGKKRPDGRPFDMIYHPGDIIEADVDLTLLNGAGMSPKFDRVHSGQGDWQTDSFQRRPGESLHDFALRMTAMAEEERKQRQADIEPLPESIQPLSSMQTTSTPIPTPTLVKASQVQLDTMSIAELKRYAADEEIDLGQTTKREDIIRVIRSSVKT